MDQTELVMQLKYLSKSYDKRKVISNVTLDVFSHSIIGIASPNGYGKSTLFHLIMNYTKPDSGNITFFNGLDYKKRKDYESIREKVVMLPNQFDLHEELTGWQHLKIYQKMWHQQESRCNEIIEDLVMEKFIQKRVSEYSLGMRQKLCFAMIYMTRGRIFLLDELTNGLDRQAIKHISKAIFRLKAEGATILMISHDLVHLQSMADKVYFLKHADLHYAYPLPEEIDQKYIYIPNLDDEKKLDLSFQELKTGRYYRQNLKLVQFLVEHSIAFNVSNQSLSDAFSRFYPEDGVENDNELPEL